jgi:hypothetical protein
VASLTEASHLSESGLGGKAVRSVWCWGQSLNRSMVVSASGTPQRRVSFEKSTHHKVLRFRRSETRPVSRAACDYSHGREGRGKCCAPGEGAQPWTRVRLVQGVVATVCPIFGAIDLERLGVLRSLGVVLLISWPTFVRIIWHTVASGAPRRPQDGIWSARFWAGLYRPHTSSHSICSRCAK